MTTMGTFSRRTRTTAALAFAAAAAWACIDATDIEVLQVGGNAVLVGQAFLDLNGNATADPTDAPLRGVTVVLSPAGATSQVLSANTDSLGLFRLTAVPVGNYDVRLDTVTFGDSIARFGQPVSLSLALGDTAFASLGATYPHVSLAEVRASPPGRRVFTAGIALNPRPSFGDGVVHFQEGAVSLRGTNVGPATLAPGDSVRLLGRTGSNTGQPILDGVSTFVLRPNAVFIGPNTPPLVTLAQAAGALSPASDAALVRVGAGEIRDTATVNGDFSFWVHAGVDSLEIVFRDFLSITPNPPIRPDTIVRLVRATGLLTPHIDAAGARWRLLPRGSADVTTETKVADIVLGLALDTLIARTGDTVTVTVTARNGPSPQATHPATAVSVSASPASGLSLLSSTVSRGSYEIATGTWTIGDMPLGTPADTLRLVVQVTTGPANVNQTAQLLPLRREVDGNPANDAPSRTLQVLP